MKKAVKICGVAQNCYIMAGYDKAIAKETNRTQMKYDSLEKKMLDNGYLEILEKKDYPINSDSVTSLADGADYKNDPLQAIANAPTRVNLGDITQAQEFLKNPQNFARVYEDTKMRLAEYYAKQRELTEVQAGEKQTKSEVENNG